jgi:hypothetical protein
MTVVALHSIKPPLYLGQKLVDQPRSRVSVAGNPAHSGQCGRVGDLIQLWFRPKQWPYSIGLPLCQQLHVFLRF